MKLEELGWDSFFEEGFKEYKKKNYHAGRVALRQKGSYEVLCDYDMVNSKLSGKLRFHASQNKDLPVVGDWVAISMPESQAIIHGVLPRKSSFSRKMPISGGRKIKNGMIQGGSTEEQVIVSNIDTAFIVCGLDNNFDLRRIERYITLVYNSGANPVIILNKYDLCTDPDKCLSAVREVALLIPVYFISAIHNQSMECFEQYMQPGRTVVFLGSSGVGKSTIINQLFGQERQRTKMVSGATGKGRHTTTYSELIIHESGCLLIDTPGSRELQLWGDENSLNESFQDIYELSQKCVYRDCNHQATSGCAVMQAIDDGLLTRERFNSFQKQNRELNLLEIRKKQLEMYQSRKTKRNRI